MGKIIEITDSYIIIEENNIKYKVKSDFIKFEPRLNDIVSFVRNDEGKIVNIFLEQNIVEKPVFIIKPEEHKQQPLIIEKRPRALFASKFVSIYSLVFWGLILMGVIYSLKDQTLFIELFKELGVELYYIPIVLYIFMGVSIGSIILSVVLLVFKNKYVKLISITPLFIIYSFLFLSSLLSMFIITSMGFTQLVFFGIPFFYCLRFLKEYQAL